MKSTAASEQKLIRGLQAGDQEAFRKVYDAYNSAIYNLCARIVGDREEAKDLTQDTFLRAFSAPPEPRAGLGLRPWLYRVATNLSLNHLRATRGGGASGDELEQVAARVDGFQQAQTVALVEETLGQLNDRYRTALVLKDLHGLPSEELASVMETSRASADVLVHRARASFRAVYSRLAGEGVPAPGNLALVLAPLAVPAALHVMPPLPPVPTPSAPVAHAPAQPGSVPMPAHPVHPLDGSGAGVGLLGKLSAALGSKVVVTAAAASVVVGGLVAEQAVTRRSHRPPAVAAAATTSQWAASSQIGVTGLENQAHTRGLVGHGCYADDGSCAAGHLATEGHHTTTAEGGHTAEHADDAAGGTHGATAGHDSTTTHDSNTGTTGGGGGDGTSTGGHDGGSSDRSTLGGGADTTPGQHD